MEYSIDREVAGKQANDPLEMRGARRCVNVSGPLIVGAGPSGLAVSACLKELGIKSKILERANCIASLWQLKTYDRLRLHLPKKFCELPLMPFPESFPTYPSKQQFVAYLEAYAKRFELQPEFDNTVESAEYDGKFWRVRTVGAKKEETEYACTCLVVATGENAEEVVPEIDGMGDFGGTLIHTSLYKSGDAFKGKKVLVVGCGNSGMEVCLDLCNNGARPSIVVRDTVGLFSLQFKFSFASHAINLIFVILRLFQLKQRPNSIEL